MHPVEHSALLSGKEIADSPAIRRLVLAADLDLTQARPLLEEMMHLYRAGEIKIDARHVDRVSTACIQVLLTAGRCARRASVPYAIENASPSFTAALCDLGVEAEFKDWTN